MKNRIKTREEYLEMVKRDGRVLQFVPDNIKDREICLEAVKRDGRVLQFVPDNIKDREICLEAVKSNGEALEFVPRELIDREICLEAVKIDGWVLQFVPDNIKDREICLEAVKSNGGALEFVSRELIDREICLEAVKIDGWALEYVPRELRDREICIEAVRNNRFGLKFVPEDLLETCAQEPLSFAPIFRKKRKIHNINNTSENFYDYDLYPKETYREIARKLIKRENGVNTPITYKSKYDFSTNAFLTKEEIEKIRKNAVNSINNINNIDRLIALCNHRDENDMLSAENLADDSNSKVICTICNKEFDLINLKKLDEVDKIINDFKSLMETIKLSYVDMPYELRYYLEFLPMLDKVKDLATLSLNSLNNKCNKENYSPRNYHSTYSIYGHEIKSPITY